MRPSPTPADEMDRLQAEAEQAAAEAHAARERLAAERARLTAEKQQRGEDWDHRFLADYDPDKYAGEVRQARERMVEEFRRDPAFVAMIDYFAATHRRYAAAVQASGAADRLDGGGGTRHHSGVPIGDESYLDKLGHLFSDAVMDVVADYNEGLQQARVDYIAGDPA